MGKRTRKAELNDRAYRYAYGTTRDRLHGDDPEGIVAVAAWEEGYRAAMRDARKIRAEAGAPGVRSDALFDYAVAMREWLRPIR